MRDKILQALRTAGHGLTPSVLMETVDPDMEVWSTEFALIWQEMESDKLVFLHRADGSANTTKGEIVLVTLREKENSPESEYRRLLNRKFQN